MPRTVTQYYTSLKHFNMVFDAKGRKMPAPTDSLESLKAWQKEARKKLWEILGLVLMEKYDLNPTVIETEDFPEYTREKVVIQTAPGLYDPITVLVPKDIKPGEKRPVFMSAFGHGKENSNMAAYSKETIQSVDPHMASRLTRIGIGPGGFTYLAREGYIVIVADARGSGTRFDFPQNDEEENQRRDNPLNNIASAMGGSKLGFEVWDYMRLADYACSRPDCDGRIGLAGSSGGGHQAMFYAALDERVQTIHTAAWFYGFQDALIEIPHNCSCNFVPGLFRWFDVCDIGSMIAPRAMQVETGMSDRLNSQLVGLGNVISQFDLTQKSFALYGAKEKLWHHVTDGGHGGETSANVGEKFLPFVHEYLPLKKA